VTIVPTLWLLLCTLSAGWLKVFSDNPKIGFLAHAHKYQAALDKGEVLAPAKSLAQMQQVVFNDYVDATLAFGFILLVVSIVLFGVRACWQAWQSQQPTARETPFTPLPAKA
jgi:carbon starvation protein